MRPIDADEALRMRDEDLNWVYDLTDLEEFLAGVPTLDVEPVKHGHWIFGATKGHSWMKCSECLKSQNGQTACFTYCPDCGAKMDEE